MPYNIVLTTAEDIVGVVDAILAKSENCNKTFIREFADLSDSQVDNAFNMAIQLGFVQEDALTSTYSSNSFLARLIVSSRNDKHKAAIMRLSLEQYEPYISFKSRFSFTDSIELAAKQIKTLYAMTSSHKDIKNSLINIATYSMALVNDGANSYKFNQDDISYIDILDLAVKFKSNDNQALQIQLTEKVYNFLDKENVFNPLSDAYSKIQNESRDYHTPIVYAGNAFESFLLQIANLHSISLVGKSGIISKSSSMSSILSKKHRGMIEYIGQIRNAADHGADPNENGATWQISDDTAMMYPLIVATLIKDITLKELIGQLLV